MSDYGYDFALSNATDGSLDIDFFSVLDNDPAVVLNSDLALIYANPGDYDWDPLYTAGAGLMNLKGRQLSQSLVTSTRNFIDTQSMGDSRIIGSTTQITLPANGTMQLVHTITVDSGAKFVSDITVNGNNVSTVIGNS